MKHTKLLYIILAFVLLFIIINKNNLLNLEGLSNNYVYIPNINKINPKPSIQGHLTFNQCANRCNLPTCKGIITDIPKKSRSNLRGECTLYLKNENDDLNMRDLKNLKYEKGSYLYINP